MPTKEEIFKYIMTNKTNPAVIESMLENIDGEIPYSQLYIENKTNKAFPLECTTGAILKENNWAYSEIPITSSGFRGKALIGDRGIISYFISRASDDLSITCNNENFEYIDKGDISGYKYSLNATPIPSQINIQINNNGGGK